MSEIYNMVEKLVEDAVKSVVMSRDDFKQRLTEANHDTLGTWVHMLDMEIHRFDYSTLTYWEINNIKSYAYVYNTHGKFASAKIAHNVRVLLLSQYTLVMTALTRAHIERQTRQ